MSPTILAVEKECWVDKEVSQIPKPEI